MEGVGCGMNTVPVYQISLHTPLRIVREAKMNGEHNVARHSGKTDFVIKGDLLVRLLLIQQIVQGIEERESRRQGFWSVQTQESFVTM